MASMMMPPSLLLPMEARLGEYYMAREEWSKAIEVLIDGQNLWPNDSALLHLLHSAFEKAGMEGDAADVKKRIKALAAE